MKIELTLDGRLAALRPPPSALRLRAIEELKARTITVKEARIRYLAGGGDLLTFLRYAATYQSQQ